MTAHRALNITLALAAIVGLYAFTQRMDVLDSIKHQSAEQDARFAALKARREELARIDFCNRSQGPQSWPVEQEDGTFRCIGKRGQRGQVVALQGATQ